MNQALDSILTGGVAVALIGLVSQLIMWYLKDRKASPVPTNPNKPDNHRFENRMEIQQTIDRVVKNSSVDRFLILKTENGGGKPRLGSHLYASVIYESVTLPMTPVKDDYQRLLVDDIYIRMLADIAPGKANKLLVSDMKAGILKDIYLVEHVEYSEVHYLWETDSAFYYLSAATSDKDNVFDTPLDRVEIEIAISKIRDIFKKVSDDTHDE
jgi:hypothetical protein